MYEHPATQANLATLRERGAIVLEPGTGALGSPGEWGVGRLPEPPELLAAIEAALGSAPGGDLDGLKVLVTAGGTREPIDAVRFIGNRSSGRMGFALADEAARRGAEVAVVAANVALPRNPAVRYVDVETAAELAAATAAEFDRCDVLLMAAAVADYRPASARADKIKKTEAELELRLERTEDVLSGLAATPPRRPADRRLRGRDRRGRARLRAREAGAQAARRGRGQRRLGARHRLRLGRERGHDRHRAAPSGTCRVRRRPRSRLRSSTPS